MLAAQAVCAAVLACASLPCASAELHQAVVASTYPAEAVPGMAAAPAVFGFTTSQDDLYGSRPLELRVVFLPSPELGHVSALRAAPTTGCHDLLAEVSDGFPPPLSCYSGDFMGGGVANRFFGLRFGLERSLEKGTAYRFVVLGLDFLAAGQAEDFAWRLELLDAGTGETLGENTTVTLTTRVLPRSMPVAVNVTVGWNKTYSSNNVLVESATACEVALTDFRVRGGDAMAPGAKRLLRLSFNFAGEVARLRGIRILFLPLLIWDQESPACQLELFGEAAVCQHSRMAFSLGYNELRISPVGATWNSSRIELEVYVLAPKAPYGLLPLELIASLETGDALCGPFFEGPQDGAVPAPLEFYTDVFPQVEITHVGNRVEGHANNPVIISIRPGADLRGFTLRGDTRVLRLSITVSSSFIVTGASSVEDGPPLGTDRTPEMEISADGRTLALSFGGHEVIAFGNVVYFIRVFVTNPSHFFGAIGEEPWAVTIEQGPRLGSQGYPMVTCEALFVGPTVDFAILGFQVLPGSLLLNSMSDHLFTFQLIDYAEQLELQLPAGYTALSCTFSSPVDLDPHVRVLLVCTPESGLIRVKSQLPNGAATALPQGVLLGFSSVVQSPLATPAYEEAVWSARALDANGAVIARTREEDEVRFQLYAQELASFQAYATDRHPDIGTVVTVQFSVGRALYPGDCVRVSAPVDFRWLFTASEFSAQISGVVEALPVHVPTATGSSHVLLLRLNGVVQAAEAYGFAAIIVHPATTPVDYQWTLETFGLGAETNAGRCYESATWIAYSLSLLLDARVVPWTYARSTEGPATFSFETTQVVGVGGALVLRSPGGFTFTPMCQVSTLQFGFGSDGQGNAPVPISSAAVDCIVLTPNEVHLTLSTGDPMGFRGLAAGSRYSVTVHSLVITNMYGNVLALQGWRLETRDAQQLSLDFANSVAGFAPGEQLPYAALLPGGPASGADARAGGLSWVTLALRVAAATFPGQALLIWAARGFAFEPFCAFRDPPAHAAPGCEPASSDLSQCVGLGDTARLTIQVVWRLRRTYAFQLHVRNAMPFAEVPFALEAPFLDTWRICIDEDCRQSRADLRSPYVSSFSRLGLLVTSSVIGESSLLVVDFALTTSTPPKGQLQLRAPSGYDFGLICNGFASTANGEDDAIGGLFAVPSASTCRVGTLASALYIVLGALEGDRLLASKHYVFAVGVRNPGGDVQPLVSTWTMMTTDTSGQLLDQVQTDALVSAVGPLLLPLRAMALHPSSRFAGLTHSVFFAFRALTSAEGGNDDLVPLLSRVELFAPVNRDRLLRDDMDAEGGDREWDLTSPPACTTEFTSRTGVVSYGLKYGNLTSPSGVAVCVPMGRRALSLTFRPSVVTTESLITLEFVVQNPAQSPGSLWNRWMVRLARLRPTVVKETLDSEVAFLGVQQDLFQDVCEANFAGYDVIRTLSHVSLSSTSFSVNRMALVKVELRTRGDVPRSAVLASTAPPHFIIQEVKPESGVAFGDASAASGNMEPLILPGTPSNRALLVFVSPYSAAGPTLRFELTVLNPPMPTSVTALPLWDFELTAAGPGTPVIERTSDFVGYEVSLEIVVAGLFGSVREISSKYNFVRVTFMLPAPLPAEGVVHIVAPPGYALLPEGFSRENMPPFSMPVLAQEGTEINPRTLNVSVLRGLDAFKYYALRFGVENPSAQPLADEIVPWEIWCRTAGGDVVAANRRVAPFELQARFRRVDVLPSSVAPLKAKNVVEVQLELDSSPLMVIRSATEHDTGELLLELPSGFRLAGALAKNATAFGDAAVDVPTLTYQECGLALAVLGPSAEVSMAAGVALEPLPFGSRCRAPSPTTLVVEVDESLLLGRVYHFAVEVENPLLTPTSNIWRVSAERNGALLHLAVEVPNFEVATVPSLQVSSTDVRQGREQLLRILIKPPRHIRGSSSVEVRAPPGFQLSCLSGGKAPPEGVLPNDTECLLLGDTLRITLPRPIPYAPYVPALLGGEEYYFAVFCQNSNFSASLASSFEVRLTEDWPVPRLLGLRAGIPAPDLAPPLDFFAVSAPVVKPAGEMMNINVRFRAFEGVSLPTAVRGILLQAPASMQLVASAGSPCVGFGSNKYAVDEAVLPVSVCTGLSENVVSIQLSESLKLAMADGSSPLYTFQLSVRSPVIEATVDSFLLWLSSGPGAAPLLAASAPGFQGLVLSLGPAQLPTLPASLVVPVPQDSALLPLSTVKLTANRAATAVAPCSAGLVAIACVLSAVVNIASATH